MKYYDYSKEKTEIFLPPQKNYFVKAAGYIIFYGTPAYGHINPTLPIISELTKQGYSVVYYATEEFRLAIEKCGAEFRAYDFGDIEWTPQIGSRILELTEVVLRFTHEQLEALLKEACEVRPVLILHDTIAFWGRAIADTMGIKAASVNAIVTSYQYTGKAFRMYAARFTGASLLQLKSIRNIMRYKRELMKRYPIKNRKLLSILMNEEELNIFTYPRQVHPEGSQLKQRCFFLGPAAILRNDTYDMDDAYPSENLIYVSLGTVFNESISFYQSLFEAFADTKYTVIVACGKLCEQLKKETVPPNVILKSYVNQKKIMEKAILFITAGGMNSICEAAVNGVPCLLYPQQGEQAINAKAFEKLGLGTIIRRGDNLLEDSEKLRNRFKPNQELICDFSTIYMDELMDKLENYVGTE